MFDFWESMGRVVANEGGLRTTLLDNAMMKAPNTLVKCEDKAVYVSVANSKFGELRPILSGELKYKPASPFAMGEWLRVLPELKEEDFEDLNDVIGHLGFSLNGRTPEFYAGLGAVVADRPFAAEVAIDPMAFPLLTDAGDRIALQAVAANAAFNTAAQGLCDKYWRPPCFVLARAYLSTYLVQPFLEIPGL